MTKDKHHKTIENDALVTKYIIACLTSWVTPYQNKL